MSFSQFCESLNFKLTPLRHDILKLLWHAKHPLKAYEVLSDLQKKRPNAKPPTVYRVLDYLIEQHVLHKLESCQSYTLCHRPGSDHRKAQHIMFLCHHCQSATEITNAAIQSTLHQLAQQHHFKVSTDLIEVEGTCKRCGEDH